MVGIDSSNFGGTATKSRRMVVRVGHVLYRSKGAGSSFFGLATKAGISLGHRSICSAVASRSSGKNGKNVRVYWG